MTGLLSPALALGAVLSTACAAIFHLWQRGDMSLLRRNLVAAWIGFCVGHFAGDLLGIHWLQVGVLNALIGTSGAVTALLIAKSLEA